MDMDISMDIHAKSVDMDMDMDGKIHRPIHGKPANTCLSLGPLVRRNSGIAPLLTDRETSYAFSQ